MKKILMITTGGTLACGETENGLVPELSADEILSFVPEIKKICDVDTLHVSNIDSTNVTIRHWQMMANAIKEFNELNSAMVGLKVAGGVSSTSDAVSYFTLVKSVLGDNWMTPEYFRIGASKLVNNLLSSVSGKDISYF